LRKIKVIFLNGKTTEELPVELVERKGKGHPDALADGIAEEISTRISKELGEPYHFSDKVFLVGGISEPKFGGGRIIKPFKVNAICVVEKGLVTREYIANIAKDYLGSTLHKFRSEFAKIEPKLIPPSKHSILTDEWEPYTADDTSLGVAYAPLTQTEKLVIKVENTLNSKEFKKHFPMVGEDIKVLALRNENKIDLTIACAFISEYIEDINQYLEIKSVLGEEIKRISDSLSQKLVTVSINPDDRPERESVYLTVIGTSIEHGDCGLTGRGNRVTGIISPSRPMCIEAVAGKSWNHPGKLYNVAALKIAETIAEELPVKEAYVKLLGKVGMPINMPEITCIEVYPKKNMSRSAIVNIAEYWLDNLDDIKNQILNQKIPIF